MRNGRTAVLGPDSKFPDPQLGPQDAPIAVGDDLSLRRVLEAYRSGIFPWPVGNDLPMFWWSPDPRCVLFLNDFRESRNLRKLRRSGKYSITFDQDFETVIQSCADRESTWISSEIQEVYIQLHQMGIAHSVECWRNSRLVGGLYGVATGKVFSGESMFSIENNTSKLALVALVDRLRFWNFQFIDCQMETEHLISFGATLIPRTKFLKLLKATIAFTPGLEDWDS